MDQLAITNVQSSFALIRPHAEQVAQLFYQNLFARAPQLRPLFKADIADQGRKLVGMLAIVVNGLSDLEPLIPAVRALGERHAGYGVAPAHYAIVGATLLATLEEMLGEAFTPEIRDAWAEAYGLLAGVMSEAGAPVDA